MSNMGTDMNGWIEIQDEKSQTASIWKPAIDIDDYPITLSQWYDLYAFLFGVRNREGDRYYKPLFANRGYPEGMDKEMQFVPSDELEQCGVTYVTYIELRNAWNTWNKIGKYTIADTNVKTIEAFKTINVGIMYLLKLMEAMAIIYGEENVRMVVWFS